MGIQSQARKKTTQKVRNHPKHQLKTNQRRATVQLAVFSSKRAFDPTKDCEVCVTRHLNQQGRCVTVPHSAHHKSCSTNKRLREVLRDLLRKKTLPRKSWNKINPSLPRWNSTAKAQPPRRNRQGEGAILQHKANKKGQSEHY